MTEVKVEITKRNCKRYVTVSRQIGKKKFSKNLPIYMGEKEEDVIDFLKEQLDTEIFETLGVDGICVLMGDSK